MWGTLGALGALVGSSSLGTHLGRRIGKDMVVRGAPASAVAQYGRYGLYGGALLGIPAAVEAGKWVARSPRWGISDWMYY
jgi:hypothetical protein